jgi:hypothetical protein
MHLGWYALGLELRSMFGYQHFSYKSQFVAFDIGRHHNSQLPTYRKGWE